MAAGNFGSPMQLLILLAIVLLLFGGKRLRNLGGDLGGAIKGFKNSMATTEAEKQTAVDTPNVSDKILQQPLVLSVPAQDAHSTSVKQNT